MQFTRRASPVRWTGMGATRWCTPARPRPSAPRVSLAPNPPCHNSLQEFTQSKEEIDSVFITFPNNQWGRFHQLFHSCRWALSLSGKPPRFPRLQFDIKQGDLRFLLLLGVSGLQSTIADRVGFLHPQPRPISSHASWLGSLVTQQVYYLFTGWLYSEFPLLRLPRFLYADIPPSRLTFIRWNSL